LSSIALNFLQVAAVLNEAPFCPCFLQVSDKRFYWIKTFALALQKNWDALEKFSKEKKPPGGMYLLDL
jgi:hypothetical protein